MSGRIHDGEARERLIVWLRERMAEFGISIQMLADSFQHDLDNAAVYHDAFGNGWSGSGPMPDWLRAAQNAGVKPDFFRIESTSTVQAPANNVGSGQLDLFSVN